MEIWPIVAWALVALTAYDFMFGKDMKRPWVMTAAFWVLYTMLIFSLPHCGASKKCDGCEDDEGPDIPYSF